MSEVKMTVEKSEQLAAHLTMINSILPVIDLEYVKEAANQLAAQASRQESMSVLNPSYPLEKNDVIRQQAKALSLLAGYIETLKEVDELKLRVNRTQEARGQLAALFL